MTNSKDKREHDKDQEHPDSKEEHEKQPTVERETKNSQKGSVEHDQKLKEQKLDRKHLNELEKEHKRLEKLKEQDRKALGRKDIAESKAETSKKLGWIMKDWADSSAKDKQDYAARRSCARNMGEIGSVGKWQGLGRDVGDFLGGRQHGWDRASTGDMDRGSGGFTDMGRGGDGRGR